MPQPRRATDEQILHELMPTVEKALDRHVSAAVAWLPHDYVPYEEGRNFVEEPWQPSDSRLPDVAQTALEVNLLTEDNLPYYHLALWRTFGDEEAWGEWVRRWTAEEGRHAIVIRDFLTVTRGVDPEALEQGRMDQALRGWYPAFAEQGPLDGVVFTTIQELATRISHRNTGALTDDPTAEKLCARVATDENLHYVFYRDMASNALRAEPLGDGHGDAPADPELRDARRRDPRVPGEGQGDGAGRHLQPADPSGPGPPPDPREALAGR